jgi:non-ribosomal peptide synthetase component E (peptide arylation enzyme)
MAMQIQRGTTRDGPEKILDGYVPWPQAYAAAYRDKGYWEGLGIADGERACAFVIAKDGSTPSLEELKAFLLTRGIAKFKLPERLELVDSFPISPAGKVLRRRLREMIEQKIDGEKAR